MNRPLRTLSSSTISGWLSTILVFCLYLLSIGAAAAPGQAQQPARLFTSHPVQVVPSNYGTAAVAANFNAKGLALGAPSFSLVLPSGEEIILERQSIERRGKNDLAWHGRVKDSMDSEAVLTLKHGLVYGRLRIANELYEFRTSKGRLLTVEQMDLSQFPEWDDDVIPVVTGEGSLDGLQGPYSMASSSEGTTTIDLLSVYSNDALNDAGSVAQMEATIQAAVDAANSTFINSNMTIRYRLVHTAYVNYSTAGTTSDDLPWVRGNSQVASLRDQYGADMVSLIVDTSSSCGTGYVQRSPGSGFADWAFQVTDIDCAVGNLTFAHEHGHNLGMEHNPSNSSVDSSGASYPWSFAHYVNGSYRTMMSYSSPCSSGCPRAQQVSNPNISYNGYSTGLTNERDNARTGEATGPISAAFRNEVVPSDGSIVFGALGDFGNGSSASAGVASLVNSWSPDFIVTAGDNRYGSSSFDQVIGQFYCSYLTDAGSGSYCNGNGNTTNALFPSPGNHDYTDGGGISEYLGYFTLPGAGITSSDTSGNERYYDFIRGPVHFFALDSHNGRLSSSDMSAQKAWLQAQLAASTSPWQVVIFHHAAYSSANHGSDPAMQWPFAGWGADAVLSAHDHTYERISIDGIPFFVNGLGGRSIYSFGTPIAGSLVRYNGDYGAMRITASNDQMTFEFINRSGTLIDSHVIQSGSTDNQVMARISSSNNDVEERASDGILDMISSDIELGDDPGFNEEQTVGLRFTGLDIPQGATIVSASLEFTVDEVDTGSTDAVIRAQAVDNAPAFVASTNNLTSRSLTSASSSWNIGSWDTVGTVKQSPDLSALVQEVVDRPDWIANNAMVFVISGSGSRTAESFDGNAAAAPLLHVEYDISSTPPTPDPMTWATAPYLDPAHLPTYNVGTMTATTASDPDSGIQYYFDCVEAPAGGYWNGCEDSGWQENNSFSDWYLVEGFTYHYRVMARDAYGNETGWSDEAALSFGGGNTAPSASFTHSVTNLTANFTDGSSDSDGSIVSWSWDFGDGNMSTAQEPSHTYAASGTYTVTLTVSDNDGAINTASNSVTVVDPEPQLPAEPTNMTATVEKSGKGKNKIITSVTLNWTDNASNETHFIIERCQEITSGKGKNRVVTCDYAEYGQVGVDLNSFEVATESGYRYRVKAVNVIGSSGYSNEVNI